MLPFTQFISQVAEILKDRPSWFRDCRAVDVVNVLPTANGGTIELLYMQVEFIFIYRSFGYYLVSVCYSWAYKFEKFSYMRQLLWRLAVTFGCCALPQSWMMAVWWYVNFEILLHLVYGFYILEID